MTFYYSTRTWNSQPQITKETIDLWKHVAKKSNWRITQLPNGFYQTEYLDLNENLGRCNTKRDPRRSRTSNRCIDRALYKEA